MSFLTLRILIGGPLISFFLLSCGGTGNKEIGSPLYFDVNAVVEHQIQLLDSLNPSLNKDLLINNSIESKTIKEVNWGKELEVFKEADINSPVLRETFLVKQVKEDQGYSITYTPKNSTDRGVTELKIKFDEGKKLENIYCKISSDNWLYSYERIFELAFEGKNFQILKNYSITNIQKILFKEKEKTNLKAQIIFP